MLNSQHIFYDVAKFSSLSLILNLFRLLVCLFVYMKYDLLASVDGTFRTEYPGY